MDSSETTEFTVTCSMANRWVPVFLGMLRQMEEFGKQGLANCVTFVPEGYGEPLFQPTFQWGNQLPKPVGPIDEAVGGDVVFGGE